MSAAKATPRSEGRRFRLHSLHLMILNGAGGASCR
jgi:hypothetical protein